MNIHDDRDAPSLLASPHQADRVTCRQVQAATAEGSRPRLPAVTPRGLTSNRHANARVAARRPGRFHSWELHGLGDGRSSPTTIGNREIVGDKKAMTDPRPRPDPRSPVQPPRSPVPLVALAVIAGSILFWTFQQEWGENSQGSPPEPGVSASPRVTRPPPAELADLFSADDYPASAIRNEQEGTVAVRLDVDTRGRVTRCSVEQSSGHTALDRTTCMILRRRARFSPATGADGQPTPSQFSTRVRWVLPQG